MSERFEAKARLFAERCLEVAALGRQAASIAPCERPEQVDDPMSEHGTGEWATCLDLVEREEVTEHATYGPEVNRVGIRWWEATDDHLERQCCRPCCARAAILRERWRLRQTVPSLKRSMLRAFSAEATR